MTSPTVTAVVIARNNAASIVEVLAALAAAPEITRIIVADNCSTDDTLERVLPTIEIVENPSNIGFGPAANIALATVKTPYALLVPATVKIPDIGGFLRECEQNPNAAILTFSMPCALFFNMALMQKVGFFDPAIFMFHEDDELFLRTQKMGYEVREVSARFTLIAAHPPAPESFLARHEIWSRLYIMEKHQGTKAAQRLAKKLHYAYGLLAAYHALRLDKAKVSLYRGKLAGIFDFTVAATPPKTP